MERRWLLKPDNASGKVFVTGANGQDGKILIPKLVEAGYEVVGTIRPDSQGSAELAGAELLPVNLLHHEKLAEVVREFGPSQIYNLGGISSVGYSWSHSRETANATGMAFLTLLEVVNELPTQIRRNTRILQASSSEIFGSGTGDPFREDSPFMPNNPYGAAKAFGQNLIRVYRSQGLHISSAILFNHESNLRPEKFVTRKISRGVARIVCGLQDEMTLGNLDARRDWGWAPEYVDCMKLIMDAATPDDFVVATGVSHSIRDFVSTAFKVAGVNEWNKYVRIDESLGRPVDAPDVQGDARKVQAILGWTPKIKFEEVVQRMVQYDLELANSEAQATR